MKAGAAGIAASGLATADGSIAARREFGRVAVLGASAARLGGFDAVRDRLLGAVLLGARLAICVFPRRHRQGQRRIAGLCQTRQIAK